MAPLGKRIRRSPFYSSALRVLAASNYHLHRPQLGKDGSIDLVVHMDSRDGKEVTRTFNFPARMQGLSFLQWVQGFQRDVAALEQSGFRPPRSQLVPSQQRQLVPGSKEAHDLFTKPPAPKEEARRHDAEVVAFRPVLVPPLPPLLPQVVVVVAPAGAAADQMPDGDEVMAVVIAVKRKDIRTLADVIDGTASILRMKPMSEVGKKKSAKRRRPPEGSTLTKIIEAIVAAGRPLRTSEMAVESANVHTHLHRGMERGELVRVSRGTYDVGPKLRAGTQ